MAPENCRARLWDEDGPAASTALDPKPPAPGKVFRPQDHGYTEDGGREGVLRMQDLLARALASSLNRFRLPRGRRLRLVD